MNSTAASGAPDPGTRDHGSGGRVADDRAEPSRRRGPPIWLVAGPTAVGKTAVGIALASRLGGEVISADSRQVYRGMTIGTSKPTAAEQAQVAHHLLDVADPLSHYTAADFARDGRAILADLERRGRAPVVVGGSGLYLQALIEGLFAGPGRDPVIRAELEARANREGTAALHAVLQSIDPESARRLHPNDRVRVIRALEVHLKSGRPLSVLKREARAPSLRARTGYFVLDRDRDDLKRRIAERTAAIFESGILDEARELLERGLGPAHAAYRTIGYEEAFAALRGELTLPAAIEAATRATRQFARRQRTWFRSVRGARWIWIPAAEPPSETAGRLLAEAGA